MVEKLFQPTLPQGERLAVLICGLIESEFQPTLPQGERPGTTIYSIDGYLISTHAPARGATISRDKRSNRIRFQPTLPQGERQQTRCAVWLWKWISTHAPARGATMISGKAKETIEISTHAPARGATETVRPKNKGYGISTHAPARGATASQVGKSELELFQPTLPQGERRQATKPKQSEQSISTHAPARGATRGSRGGTKAPRISTHAPARGATKTSTIKRPRWEFQPTLPQGERRGKPMSMINSTIFQPTLPQGERPHDQVEVLEVLQISTHAPARGATIFRQVPQGTKPFQPTLPQGERRRRNRTAGSRRNFNPRSRKGSDRKNI